jgi:hypothetical protein
MRKFTIIAALLLVAFPFVGEANNVAPCQIAGTWYGGSGPDAPYLLTIEPGHAGRFNVTFQWAGSSDIAALYGYDRWTTWSGEAEKTEQGEYELRIISYWMYIHEFAVTNGIDDSKPELDMAHAYMKFADCDRLDVEIDMFAGFVAFDPALRTPFVAPYDWSLPDGESLFETYQRMPSTEVQDFAAPRLNPLSVMIPHRKWRHR